MENTVLANKKLKNARTQMNLTQSQVAKACGITLRQYQRLENAESSLNLTSFFVGVAICDLLKIDVHDLIQ